MFILFYDKTHRNKKIIRDCHSNNAYGVDISSLHQLLSALRTIAFVCRDVVSGSYFVNSYGGGVLGYEQKSDKIQLWY